MKNPSIKNLGLALSGVNSFSNNSFCLDLSTLALMILPLFLVTALSLFSSISLASGDCVGDYHVATKKLRHNIPPDALQKIRAHINDQNPSMGWKEVSQWGDEYAAIASRVLSKNGGVQNKFYRKLIATHWINVNGIKPYKENFLGTARQHFRQYVEMLETGYWPDSDQIVLSYLKSARDHNLPDLIVFDAAWDAAGLNGIRSWQSLNHLQDTRTVYPTRACFNIDSFEARRIITEDFAELPIELLISF